MKIKVMLWWTVFIITLLWSGYLPFDRFTWLLEVIPAIVGALYLQLSYKKIRFSDFTYSLILLHCIILMIGGHYSYAKVPVFDYLTELFDWSRNNYDKVGHFAQGFVPCAILREVLVQKKVVTGRWLVLFCLSFCLAFSAFYELIEWWVALLTGENASAFLGTQGYIWDTQADMFFALIGALTFLLLATRYQDRSILKINSKID